MRRALAAVALGLMAVGAASAQTQAVDPAFKPVVEHPAFAKNGPVLAIDQAHENFHTMDGRYQPFAMLARLDGYRVQASAKRFSAAALKGIDVLVIANAGESGGEVFTDAECDALHAWVEGGGSLLLIADHAPFGASTAKLGKRFGVDMGKGFALVPTPDGGVTTSLDYTRDAGVQGGRLGAHPIMEGRNASERISLVRAYTGQSLGVPKGSTVLLKMADDAREAAGREDLDPGKIAQMPSDKGRAQGLAMAWGRGRVVVLGEAGMFSAQVVTYSDGRDPVRFGMNLPGTDDKQFALNVLHWLSRVIG
jgi:hypothetical protein